MNKKERIFLDAMKHADRRYFTELSGRLRNPKAFTAAQKGRAFDMEKHEKKRKITKIAVGTLIAAAVLGGGGMAAMVAMHGSLGGYNQYSGTDSLISSSESRTDALGLNLTETEWCDIRSGGCYNRYGQDWFTGSDSGWYHQKDYSVWSDLHYENMSAEEQQRLETLVGKYLAEAPNSSTLWYYDLASGEDLPLCARANCLHDGNEYCEATSNKYSRGTPMYYDGVLYAPARSTDGEHPKEQRICLLSYDLNGTGITELATFEKGDADPLGIIIHRGYVFCMFRVYAGGEMTAPDPTSGSYHPYQGSGYVIWGYEIATGKTTELLRVMPKENNSKGFEKVPDCFTAGGDYVYFGSSAAWPATYTTGFYGIDLRTGEVSRILNVTQAAPVGKRLIYRTESSGKTPVCIYDTETGDTQEYLNIPGGNFASDGTHIFVMGGDTRILIYDMEMNPLGTLDADDGYGFYDPVVKDGWLYLGRTFYSPGEQPAPDVLLDTLLVRYRIDDILSGSAVCEKLCTIEHDERESELLKAAKRTD